MLVKIIYGKIFSFSVILLHKQFQNFTNDIALAFNSMHQRKFGIVRKVFSRVNSERSKSSCSLDQLCCPYFV